jgi:hypothetical protein
MDPVQRRKTARKVEIGGQVGAAVAGTGLGAAKLRDAYAEDNEQKFARGVNHLHTRALKVGASPERAANLVRVAVSGKPHFKQIALGAAAAGAATGAQRYQSYSRLKQRRSEYAKTTVAKTEMRMKDEHAVRSGRYSPQHTASPIPRGMKKAKLKLVPVAMNYGPKGHQVLGIVNDLVKSAFGIEHAVAGLRRGLGKAPTQVSESVGTGFRERQTHRAGTWSRNEKRTFERHESSGRNSASMRTSSGGGLTTRGKLATAVVGASAAGTGEEGRRTYLRRVAAHYPTD